MRRGADGETKLTLIVGGQETVVHHRRTGRDDTALDRVERGLQWTARSIGYGFVVFAAAMLVWMLVKAGISAWNSAGETQLADGTPAWPLRAMLLAFTVFVVALGGLAISRALRKRPVR